MMPDNPSAVTHEGVLLSVARIEKLERAFVLFTFVFFAAYFALCTLKISPIGDFYYHLAGVSELLRDFFDPRHETLAVASAYSAVLSPYHHWVAILGAVLAVDGYTAMQIAGIGNLVLYLLAVYTFFRACSASRHTLLPVVFFLFTSLFLRDRIFYWSSETSIDNLRFITAYPSFFAWSLSLFAFSASARFFATGKPVYVLLLVPVLWLVTLVHALTASWVYGIVGLMLLRELWRLHCSESIHSPKSVAFFAAAVAASLPLLLLWPYFDPVLLAKVGGLPETAPFKEGLLPLTAMATLYLLAIPSFALLWRSENGRFLLSALLATAGALLLWRLLGLDFGSRYMFFAAFFAQVAVADAAGSGARRALDYVAQFRWRERGHTVRLLPWMTVTVLTLAALYQSDFLYRAWRDSTGQNTRGYGIGELASAPNAADAFRAAYEDLAAMLDPGDTIIASPDDNINYHVAALTGARAVAVRFALRVPDFARRKRDANRFFAGSTPPDQTKAILHKYRVDYIVLTADLLEHRRRFDADYGLPLLVSDSFIVYRAPTAP